MADDLMLEVTGSSQKAQTALDAVITKITNLQETFEKATPSLTAFTEKMNSLAASSKAVSAFNSVANTVQKSTLATQNAESRMAMYQARLDRAAVSSERSRQQLEKLAEAHQKAAEAAGIDAKNEAAFANLRAYGTVGMRDVPSIANQYSAPNVTDVFPPTPPVGHSKIASEIPTVSKGAINIDAAQADLELQKMQAYIDALSPSIAGMSADAQAAFEALSGKLLNVSMQIDNQQALYRKLAIAAQEAATAHGTGSVEYLRLEKQMLSADTSIQRLISQEEKLKAQMSGVSGTSERAGIGLFHFGKQAETASSHATSGFQKTLQMMEKMFIRIAAFRIFSAIQEGITTGINNMVLASSAANQTMSALSTSALYLKNSIASALMPAIQALTPAITNIVDRLADLFNMIGMLTARIFNHASTVTIAKKSNVDYAATLNQTAQAADAAKKAIMGFDELNVLQSSTASNPNPGMPDPSTMFETVKIPGWIEDIGKITDPFTKTISDWWNSLTDPEKWGAGTGAFAGTIIGGIIGHLICPGIGTVLGMMLGGTAGTVIGKWWTDLTDSEKWSAGIGAGAGAVVGGIIGGILTSGNPIGIAVGAVLGITIGGIIGKWWSDLTTPEKWSAQTGAMAGSIIGEIIGGLLTGGNPIGMIVGLALGAVIGGIIGKWWTDLTEKQKWSAGIGAGAGAIIGGIIGTMICPGIGTILGAALGSVAGGLIGKWWTTLTSKEKWSVGTSGIGIIIGAIIGTIFLGPLGTVLGAGIGGMAGKLIEQFWDYLSNKNNWQVGKGIGIGATIGAIIGTIIGGPLGAAIGAALGGAAGYGIDYLVNKHARGTMSHPGGPALVNDQPGPLYRELVQLPSGFNFIPQGRNVFLPNLPRGAKVLPAPETRLLLPNYANGIGELDYSEMQNSLNDVTIDVSDVFARKDNSLDTDRIIERLDNLESAIRNLNIKMYADDRELARSSNQGNRILDRRQHPIATT